MGLTLVVGQLADLNLHEPEETEYFRDQLAALNKALAAAGVPAHHEPSALPNGGDFSHDMWGYSGLHYLRRVAAWDALGRGLPQPGDYQSSDDPVVHEYNDCALEDRPLRYRHLMLHSDCEGYYVPQDFDEVIFPDDELGVAGCMIGSTHQLLAECVSLADILGLPLDIDPEADEVLPFVENQGQAGVGWQRYGVESFSCLQLINACKASIKSGALIVFG